MKKLHLILLLGLGSSLAAQNPTYQQKLYYTCKVWGFVKYYHSNVSTCGVNWDSVLIHCLPLVKSAVTQNDFNDALDTMLNAAGPMALTSTPRPDTMAPDLKRNLNFGWLNAPIFRADVQTILDTIKNNFRPHAECWVQNNSYTNSYNGWLVFPYDSLMMNQDFYTNFPDEWHRLLVLYKEWNIINYFNPYNYTHDLPWDSALYRNVLIVDNATNDLNLYESFRKVTAYNNDAHTEGLTYDANQWFPYGYSYKLVLKYIPGKYVVVQTGIPSIHNGDEIISVGGLSPKQWEDSLGPYVSAGDSAVFRRAICSYMLCGGYSSAASISYFDSNNTLHSINAPRTLAYYDNWFYTYYPNDTLSSVDWKYWSGCNIGYVNMGILQQTSVNTMYSALRNTSAIIFDIRNYPNGTAWSIADLMYPNQTLFDLYTIPDVTYPGTFYAAGDYLGINGNPTPYLGKVIILFNEETQSQAEFSCMILDAMPNVVKVGSHTAGTDGNITYYRICKYIQTGFTTLGEYYPNGDSTERVGIIPDTLIYPTQAGIRHGRDEVLEKALQIVGCPASVSNINEMEPIVKVYPNPAITEITFDISSGNNGYIQLSDVTGKKIASTPIINNHAQMNVSGFSAGMYFYEVTDKSNRVVDRGKFSVVR